VVDSEAPRELSRVGRISRGVTKAGELHGVHGLTAVRCAPRQLDRKPGLSRAAHGHQGHQGMPSELLLERGDVGVSAEHRCRRATPTRCLWLAHQGRCWFERGLGWGFGCGREVVPRGQLAAQEGEMYGRGYRGRVGAEGSGELTAQLLVCGERLGLASVDGQARIMRAVSRSSAGRCRTASRK